MALPNYSLTSHSPYRWKPELVGLTTPVLMESEDAILPLPMCHALPLIWTSEPVKQVDIFREAPMILRAKTSLYSKSTRKAIFWIQRPQNRGGPHENIFKRLSYPFFPKKWPRGGGGGGVLPDFTRRGTNYLHTTLLKTYPKSKFLDSESMFF